MAAAVVVVILLGGYYGYKYLQTSGSGQIDSVAVLPFENRSGNADTDYLSDGLSESLIYRLSQLPGLKVSPTNAVQRYRNDQTDIEALANDLDVQAVVTGRLAQRGEDLTISVELTDARTKS
jgi:TolB-like protein